MCGYFHKRPHELFARMKTHQDRTVPLAFLAVALVVSSIGCGEDGREAADISQQTHKPNILIILVDDMGYADLGVHGSDEMKTINIDSLAGGGIRFTNAYVTSPICSPSRAGLLTGRYGSRFGFEHSIPRYAEHGLPAGEKTIADYLKDEGYRTYCVGKWHLGEKEEYHPNNRGFDEFYGFLGGRRHYFALSYRSGWERLEHNGLPIEEPEGSYLTDRLGQQAVDYIEEHTIRHKGQPFFMYLSYYAVHTPLQIDERRFEKAGTYYPFKNVFRQILAGMTIAVDETIGQVLDTLRRTSIYENTLVIFLSDNGGPTRPGIADNWPLRGGKGALWEGGIRIPLIVQWPDRIPAGGVIEHPVISLDLLPTIITAANGVVSPDDELDGVNLLPLIEGREDELPERSLFWRRGGATRGICAIRKGHYKLWMNRSTDVLKLFDLRTDVGERRDMASTHPNTTLSLQHEYGEWEKHTIAPFNP